MSLAQGVVRLYPWGWGLFIVFWDHSGSDTSCFKNCATVLVVRLYVWIHDKVTPHVMTHALHG